MVSAAYREPPSVRSKLSCAYTSRLTKSQSGGIGLGWRPRSCNRVGLSLPGSKIVVAAEYDANLHQIFLSLACTRFRRHQVWCENGTRGGSWSVGSLRWSSNLKLCA